MVSYQRWTSICYEVARQKGASLEGSGTQDENQALISLIAEVWNDRKDEISSSTVAESRRIAQAEITVA